MSKKISTSNPFVDNTEKQEKTVWSTKMVDYAVEAMNEGYKVKHSPFHEGKLELRKANIVFQYTKKELDEIKKCANDVIYFAENYAYVMTDEGVRKVGKNGLRDYQEDILQRFHDNPLSVLCSCRQSGKCSLGSQLKIKNKFGEIYELPIELIFHLNNSRNNFIGKIKTFLYKTVKIRKFLKYLIYKLIELIERYEYRNLDLDQNDINKKIIDSINLEGCEVWTDTGWEPVSSIHKTQPYDIWYLETESGLSLECADIHRVYDENYQRVYIKDLNNNSKVVTSNGLEKVETVYKTNNTVSMYDLTVDHPNHRFYTNDILSSNTVTSCIFIAHYLLFNFDKNALLLANKEVTTKEIISKAKTVFENLPFFMKPGVLTYDKMGVSFDNGCKLIGQSTSSRSGIGFTIHMLFLDEFAHIPKNIIEPFYENVMPTISSSNVARVIITSTVNGYNLFYTIWSNSPKNGFHPIEVNWWQVPGRDQKWKEKEIARLGSEDAFDRQHGNKFMTSSNLLLDSTTIERFQRNIKIYKPTEENFEIWEFSSIEEPEIYLKWNPDFNVDDLSNPNCYFVLSVDVGEGLEQDHSVINIFKIQEMEPEEFDYINSPGSLPDFFKLKQVGIFDTNDLIPKYFAEALYIIGFELIDSERMKIVLEWNKYGELVLSYLESTLPQINKFEHESVVETKHTLKDKDLKPGVYVKTDNKSLFCHNFKDIAEQRRIDVNESDTIEEFKYFGRNGKGSYEAQQGHDDKAMSCVISTEFFRTFDFIDLVEEYADTLNDDWHKAMNEKLELTAPDGEGSANFDIYDII